MIMVPCIYFVLYLWNLGSLKISALDKHLVGCGLKVQLVYIVTTTKIFIYICLLILTPLLIHIYISEGSVMSYMAF